jgi:hypothetical protein
MKKLITLSLIALLGCSKTEEPNCIQCEYPSINQGTFIAKTCKEDVSDEEWQAMEDIVGMNEIVFQDTVLYSYCFYTY